MEVWGRMSGTPSIYTQKGIAALKAGNSNLARQFFDAALDENPNDELAWLWLSGVVHTPDKKRECLKRVLAINPNNAAAKHGLDILGPEPVAPLAPFPAEPVESATPPMAAKPVEPARPLPHSRGERKRGGQGAILIVLGIGVIGVFGLLVVALASQSRAGLPAAQAGPIVTPGRPPPTWTPTPTGAPTPTPTPRAAPTQLQPLVEAAIRARELEPIASIHYVLSAQFDIDLYLRNDIDAQSVVLANTFWDEMRALGLVDFELEYDRQRIIDLTSRQLAGFYSPTDKTLYAVTRSSRVDPGEYVVIVHEYVHALTDMHFDLSRLLYAERTIDSDLAARALAEGDATLAENSTPWAFYQPDDWKQYAQDVRAAVPLYREFGISAAFLLIQTFPYAEGWEFVWTLRESGGWEAVNQAYDRVPVSTEQILHPDRYSAGNDLPRALTLPEIEAPSIAGYDQVVASDRLGEFVLSVLLDEFIRDESRARQAAAGWGGDAFRAWTDRFGNQAYALLTAWDTEEDAREFMSPAAEMLSIRTGARPPFGPDVEAIYFDGKQGQAYLSRNGDQVLILWSSKTGLRDEMLAAFPDF